MTFRFQDVPGPKRDLIGYGRHAPRVRWPNDARLALNFVINYEEGSEKSHPAGDARNDGLFELPFAISNKYRDLGGESLFEYGSRAGVWRLQRLFDSYQIPVTFYACAVALELNPEVCAWLKEMRHEPACHGWRWEQIWRLPEDEEREHIRLAVESIQQTCGDRPRGWYSRWCGTPRTRELLVEEGGFTYDSDSYADDLPYFTEVNGGQHLVIPYNLTYNDVHFVMPQGYASLDQWVDFICRGIDYYWAEGATHPKMMTIGLHPRIVGHAARTSALERVIDYAGEKGDIWFARRLDIANWWLEHHTEFETDA